MVDSKHRYDAGVKSPPPSKLNSHSLIIYDQKSEDSSAAVEMGKSNNNRFIKEQDNVWWLSY